MTKDACVPSLVGPRLWQIRWVQDLVGLLGLIFGLWLLVQMQAAVIPVLVAFVLAYVLEPLIQQVESRFHWRRLWIVLTLMLLMTLGFVGLGLLLAPTIVEEAKQLFSRLPEYMEAVRVRLGVRIPEFKDLVKRISELPAASFESGFGSAGKVVGTLTQILGITLSLVTASVLTTIIFAFFALRFPSLPSLEEYLPASQRAGLLHRFRQVEHIFSAFFRGQLVVAGFTTTVFSVGFAISGVPYWSVAALVGGVFSIVPYGQGLGWVLAVLFNALEASEPVNWLAILVPPTIVYMIMQSLETFVITPIVQGSSTKLHPIVVILAVVAGASLGGIVGAFLAIPLAAIGKTFLLELFLPWLKDWAAKS